MVRVIQIRKKGKVAEIDISRENADFNFPKIHFREHLPKYISSYSHVGQYSTKIVDQPHKKQIKEGWRKSNHVDTIPQIIKQGDNYCSIRMKVDLGLSIMEP